VHGTGPVAIALGTELSANEELSAVPVRGFAAAHCGKPSAYHRPFHFSTRLRLRGYRLRRSLKKYEEASTESRRLSAMVLRQSRYFREVAPGRHRS